MAANFSLEVPLLIAASICALILRMPILATSTSYRSSIVKSTPNLFIMLFLIALPSSISSSISCCTSGVCLGRGTFGSNRLFKSLTPVSSRSLSTMFLSLPCSSLVAAALDHASATIPPPFIVDSPKPTRAPPAKASTVPSKRFFSSPRRYMSIALFANSVRASVPPSLPALFAHTVAASRLAALIPSRGILAVAFEIPFSKRIVPNFSNATSNIPAKAAAVKFFQSGIAKRSASCCISASIAALVSISNSKLFAKYSLFFTSLSAALYSANAVSAALPPAPDK